MDTLPAAADVAECNFVGSGQGAGTAGAISARSIDCDTGREEEEEEDDYASTAANSN